MSFPNVRPLHEAAIVPALMRIQQEFGFLKREEMEQFSKESGNSYQPSNGTFQRGKDTRENLRIGGHSPPIAVTAGIRGAEQHNRV